MKRIMFILRTLIGIGSLSALGWTEWQMLDTFATRYWNYYWKWDIGFDLSVFIALAVISQWGLLPIIGNFVDWLEKLREEQ